MTQSEIDAIEQALWEAYNTARDFDNCAARYISDMIEGFTETFYPEEDD
jgi:hypothetical protein